ncbi:helix-turn-helix domain-containing protein [Mucilaginibacter sp. HMF5004]|uniref:helix-turn-helix domain-containing protein n=1 Tax=Mucilaginibacter rivuli TaxID=2857527 RepID=UPI001C604833|nr:helix-turn-helix domain-containing protein [Mucilaginibacter rivuli]
MLRVIRQNLGLNQKHVSKLLGHKRSAMLSDWENAKAMPSSINLMKLCIIYNKTPKQLYPEYFERLADRIYNML